MDDTGGVCLVTQPHRGQVGKDHAHDLADIIAQITTVTVLTANLPANAAIRDDHDTVEFSSAGTGEFVLVEALRFLLNQLRLCRIITRRDEESILFFGTTSYLLPVLCGRLLGKRVLVLPRGDVPLSVTAPLGATASGTDCACSRRCCLGTRTPRLLAGHRRN